MSLSGLEFRARYVIRLYRFLIIAFLSTSAPWIAPRRYHSNHCVARRQYTLKWFLDIIHNISSYHYMVLMNAVHTNHEFYHYWSHLVNLFCDYASVTTIIHQLYVCILSQRSSVYSVVVLDTSSTKPGKRYQRTNIRTRGWMMWDFFFLIHFFLKLSGSLISLLKYKYSCNLTFWIKCSMMY